MIARIKGKVVEKTADVIIVDVAGIGYAINLTQLELERLNLGDETQLFTYHLVREQTQELFGFTSLAAKKLFELLLTVQGIGPRSAMSILSLAPLEPVRNAIANGDTAFLAKASGVGKRSAARIAVDLRDKVGLPSHYGRLSTADTSLANDTQRDDALDALIALGFSLADATMRLEKIDPKLPVSERIRQALKDPLA